MTRIKLRSGERLSNEVAELSNKIIICNWFSRDTLEALTGEEISIGEYQRFNEWLKDSSMYDNCSEMVREMFDEFLTEGDD